MLISAIRKSVSCNPQRIAACVTYKNKMWTKIARQCNESNLLSISPPSIAACRIYSTESNSKPSLPILVTDAKVFKPSFFTSFRVFFMSYLTIPNIDKEFSIFDVLKGIRYAVTVISKALANEDYDSLEGLVAKDMIEILRTKIQTLTPEQRQLIAVNEEDIVTAMLSNIVVRTDEEHSIEIKVIYYYVPGITESKKLLENSASDLFENSLMCNYTFFRKYVNNVGDPWIATFVNHFSAAIFRP